MNIQCQIKKLLMLEWLSSFRLGGGVWVLLLAARGVVPLMVLGGFLAALGDDALELHSDAILQHGFPSGQRATLASVSSLCFSLVMVVLSPMGGLLAEG